MCVRSMTSIQPDFWIGLFFKLADGEISLGVEDSSGLEVERVATAVAQLTRSLEEAKVIAGSDACPRHAMVVGWKLVFPTF